MTYREQREAKAERLRGWADKRDEKASSSEARARQMADAIPFGQPVMGARDARYRERMRDTFERGYRDSEKASSMRARADGIEAQAAGAIYSDDADALEALAAKVERLEGERSRWKAYNAACRKAGACTAEALEHLDERQRRDIASTARSCPEFLGKAGQAPAYVLTNLGGNITRLRKRITELERARGATEAAAEALEALEVEAPEAGGLPTVASGVTRRGAAYVVLTPEQVRATADSGLVRLESGESAVWYSLGKEFDRDGETVRYGYLRFDRAVSEERSRRRSQAAWDSQRSS